MNQLFEETKGRTFQAQRSISTKACVEKPFGILEQKEGQCVLKYSDQDEVKEVEPNDLGPHRPL